MLAWWLAALAALSGTRVLFEHLHSGSQLSVTLVPVDPTFSPALGSWGACTRMNECMHTCVHAQTHTHTYTHVTHTYMQANAHMHKIEMNIFLKSTTGNVSSLARAPA